jgi:para-nitrobenzyl esterase
MLARPDARDLGAFLCVRDLRARKKGHRKLARKVYLRDDPQMEMRSTREQTWVLRVVGVAAAAVIGTSGLSACSSDGGNAAGDSTTTTVDTRTYEGAQVKTAQGEVVGTVADGSRSFLGIPYAAPPTGDGRWAPPRAAARWDSPRPATSFGAACQQRVNTSFGTPSVGVSEDCLFLNVHAPAVAKGKRPVMVWFHGGGYTGGMGGDYDGRGLARDDDLVVVTVNYRLGVFGFLATSGLTAGSRSASSGNYGIQDQRAALEWVRDNIAGFGGDPSRVAVVGESAGAGSVCVHLLSPESRGLFDTAIMESGSCVGTQPTLTLDDAEKAGDAFAARLGCTGAGAAVVTCLRAKTADELRDAAGGGSTGGATALPLRPIVDGVVLPDQPKTLLEQGKVNVVPVISGFNSDEGSTFVYLEYELKGNPVTADGYRAAVEKMFVDGTDVDAVVEHYPTSKYRTPSNALAAARTDQSVCRIMAGTRRFAEAVPTYTYEFADRDTPFLGGKPPTLDMGAGHGFELQYLFGSQGIPLVTTIPTPFDERQKAVARSLIGYWSAFLHDGRPGSGGGPEWPRFRSEGGRRVVFGSDATTVVTVPKDEHQCSFWEAQDVSSLRGRTGSRASTAG